MIIRSFFRLILISLILFLSCQREDDLIPPSIIIDLFPTQGDTSSYFCFDGSRSTDNMSEIWQMHFQWDFNSDGIWDTELSTNPKYVWKFPTYGTKTVILKVVDHAGVIGQASKNITISPILGDTTFVDSRDGNRYHAVRIDTLWWMSENLRFGKEITIGTIPADDGIVEKFMYRDSLNQPVISSGYYNWNEATYYGKSISQGVCPEGWRLAAYTDYLYLYKRFVLYLDPYNLFKPGGYLGLDFTCEGLYSFINGSFSHVNDFGFLLISQKSVSDDPSEHYLLYYHSNLYFPYTTYSGYGDEGMYPVWWDRESWGNNMDFNKLGINVRCVKKSK